MTWGKTVPSYARIGAVCAVLIGSLTVAQSPPRPVLEFAPAPGATGRTNEFVVGIANYGTVPVVLDRVMVTSGTDPVWTVEGDLPITSKEVLPGEVSLVTLSSRAFEPSRSGQLEFRLVVPGEDSGEQEAALGPLLLLGNFSVPSRPFVPHWLGIASALVLAASVIGGAALGAENRPEIRSHRVFINDGSVKLHESWSVWFSAVAGAGVTAVLPALSAILGSGGLGAVDPLVVWGVLVAAPFAMAPIVLSARPPTDDELLSATGFRVNPMGRYVAVGVRSYFLAQFLILFSAFSQAFLVTAWLEKLNVVLLGSKSFTTAMLIAVVVLVWVTARIHVHRLLNMLISASIAPESGTPGDNSDMRPANGRSPLSRRVVRVKFV